MIKKLLSFPYQLAHLISESVFNVFGEKKKLPRPVISIGNISFGGTGKTPVTYEIVKYLSQQGKKVAILSRGYKSQYENSCMTFSSSETGLDAKIIGDEPFMLLEKFKADGLEVYFAIGRKRYENGLELLERFPEIDCFVLDDGLQHFKLARDIEIILENANENGFYREFDFALKKADFLIHTKVDENWIKENLGKNCALFNLELTQNLQYEGANVGVFTAIADYASFVSMLKRNLNLTDAQVQIIKYSDHHYFSLQEIERATDLGIELVTTEKDWCKIPEEFRPKFKLAKLVCKFEPKELLTQIFQQIT